MSKKTKTGQIPSLDIDQEFLKKLGVIIELEAKERMKKAENELKKTIQKKSEDIDKRTYYNGEKEKQEAIESMIKHEEYISKPHIGTQYTIRTKDEKFTFDSIEEILGTSFFPTEIESFSIFVSHYNGEYVDIDLSIRKPIQFLWTGFTGEYNLSSENEGKILKLEKDLKSLFYESINGYQRFLYPSTRHPFIINFIIAFLFSAGVTYLGYFNLNRDTIWLFLTTNIFGYYFLMNGALRWLFPYYSYRLGSGKRKTIKTILRIILFSIFTSVVVPVLVDLIKNVIKKP